MKIKTLQIYSSNIAALSSFYGNLMGLPIVEQTATRIAFQIGNSVLVIQERATATPYHFAINIPANKQKEALAWLKQRVEILPYEGHEIQDFDFWNAKAIYFYDPDHNIVELIARNNLDNSTNAPFDQNAWLEISEIGMPVQDIEPVFNDLHAHTGAEVFSGSFESFCAIGGEHGLFICIDRRKRKWFPLNDEAYPSDFSLEGEHAGNMFNLQFANEVLQKV